MPFLPKRYRYPPRRKPTLRQRMIGYLLVLASFAIGAYWHWSDLVESRSTRHRLHALEAEQLNKAIGTAVEVPAQGVADTIP